MADFWSNDPVTTGFWKSDPISGAASGFDAADVAQSLGIGVVKSGLGLAGLAGDASELGARGIDEATRFVGKKLGYGIVPRIAPKEAMGGVEQLTHALESLTGPLYEPKTTAGDYAQTIGEFAPTILGGGGGLVSKLARPVVTGLASEAAGQATKGTGAEPYARIAGAIAGGAAPSIASRAVTPLPISAERQAMVDALKNEGVTSLTAGQISGRKGLQYLENALADLPFAGGKASQLAEQQSGQLTKATLKRMGIDSERATPDVIDAGVRKLGNEFDAISARNTLKADPRFTADLSRAEAQYNGLTVPSQRAPIVQKLANDLQGFTIMPGEQYQALRSQLSKQADKLRISNPPLSDALRDMRKALDGAMNRSISTADRGAWAELRRQWGNWKTIAKTNISGNGLISPATLKQAARSGRREDYARGRGDFNELARTSSEIMKALPQSGTAPRIYAQNFLPTLLGGAGAGGAFFGIPGALAGAAAVTAPPIAGRTLMSNMVQNYLKNQKVQPVAPRARDALLRSILALPTGLLGTQ